MAKYTFEGKRALVTGAGSGIGRATALALAERGADLFICDIQDEGLGQTASQAERSGVRVWAERVDVADREAMAAYADEVHAEVGSIDILVNNAGVAVSGHLTDMSLEDWDWIIGVNLWGVIYGLHFFVPNMVERGRGGRIINIASAAGLIGVEFLSAYCATKFALVGLSESLHVELAQHGIGVTAICPGVVKTPIVESGRMLGEVADPSVREKTRELFDKRGCSPEHVAQRILKAIVRNETIVPVTAEAHVAYRLKRVSPALLGAIQKRLRSRFFDPV